LPFGLWVKPGCSPRSGIAGKQETVVQAVVSAYPELYLFRVHAEAAPVGRARDFSRMVGGKFAEACIQFLAAG
jgi:hypothetical protein